MMQNLMMMTHYGGVGCGGLFTRKLCGWQHMKSLPLSQRRFCTKNNVPMVPMASLVGALLVYFVGDNKNHRMWDCIEVLDE